MAFTIKKNVCWLNITMHDIAAMDEGNCNQAVINYLEKVVLSEINLMFHQLVEIGFDVFHNDANLTKICFFLDISLSKRFAIDWRFGLW
jgi:hypothetical protein